MTEDAKIIEDILKRLASEISPFYLLVARELKIKPESAQNICRRFGFNLETGKRVEARTP